ncbi:MAG: tRNA lysidine(34) synthetase TilS [Actinomycetaceae bacterium]|nr:tRNA lysidine(34) synthetase TilS [Actinomycetaceae bacterium]MDU0970551.1 tRNA lysidine(34) synthetase TilS [Actinomycetaceae bacterium]
MSPRSSRADSAGGTSGDFARPCLADGSLPPTASELVGRNPRGALGQVSLAVRRHLIAAFPQPVTLLLAVSGGSDSLALALAVADLAPRLGHRVTACTIDHGLRPESAAEARQVARVLAALGVANPQVATVSLPEGGGPEGAARTARWRALRTYAGRLHAADGRPVAICTGHTADDQAEGVLLALARGSGTHALAGMASGLEPGPRQMVEVHRPLLDVRRSTVRAALAQAGLAWIEDPTNRADGPWRAADGSPLRRAAVREDALPALARALGVDPVPALARTARLARADDAALAAAADALVEAARVDPPQGADCAADVAILAAAPDAVRARALRALSVAAGAREGDLSAAHVAGLDAFVTSWSGQGALDLPGRVRARRVPQSETLTWWRD